MNVLIVGAGAMGTWFAEVVQDAGTITFTDIDTQTAADAARRYDAQTLAQDDDRSFEVVCLAVPISAVATAVREYGPRAEQAVIDLSGTMARPIEAMRSTVPDRERISLHPLFAPENAPGNVPIVVENGGPVARRVRQLLADAGCRVVDTTVAEHDTAMETIQAKAHAALLAYALVADPVPEGYHTPVSAGLAELVDELLGGTPHVYAEIQAAFDGAEEVAEAASRLASADREGVESLYRTATERHAERADDGT